MANLALLVDSIHVDNSCCTMWFRYQLTMFTEALNMILDSLLDLADCRITCAPGGDATRQVGYIGSIVSRRFLNNDGVLHLSFTPYSGLLHDARPYPSREVITWLTCNSHGTGLV